MYAIRSYYAELVAKTLNGLAALDYPNFEVLVIDNNTVDEKVWQPVEQYCARLGERFRFFHLPKWPGYKAGALNFARITSYNVCYTKLLRFHQERN